jgi:hypothetical protein
MTRSLREPLPETDLTEHAINRIRRLLDEIRPMLRQNEHRRKPRKES